MDIDIIRAWKDADYRASLSAEEQALIPANPAGIVELSDTDLALVHGTGDKKKRDVKIINDISISTSGLICVQTTLLDLNLVSRLGLLGNGSSETTVCYSK